MISKSDIFRAALTLSVFEAIAGERLHEVSVLGDLLQFDFAFGDGGKRC